MTRAERVAMVDRGRADLSVRRQCALLGLARSGVYRQPVAPDLEELALMRWIDKQYLATPFYGSRRMTAALRLAWSIPASPNSTTASNNRTRGFFGSSFTASALIAPASSIPCSMPR